MIQSVHETERFFRVRKLAGNLKLVKSEGAYAAIYKRKGLDGAECAKDARVMYMRFVTLGGKPTKAF